MHLRFISGFAFATAVAFAGAVATAASDGQGLMKQTTKSKPAQAESKNKLSQAETKSKLSQAEAKSKPAQMEQGKEKEKKTPDEPKGNLDRLEIKKLEELLAQQRQLLDRLDRLEGTTLPNAFHGVHDSILDSLADLQNAVLEAVGGLETQCTTPDVLPLPAPGTTGPYGFCQFNADNTKLLVRVYNQGGVAAAASTTRVSFFGGVVTDQATPALAAFGGSVNLLYDIPESCYGNIAGDSNCPFTIATDVANVVAEGNEPNNVAAGICIRVG
jgi:hypothetical protein